MLDPSTPEGGRPHPYPPEIRAQRSGPLRQMAADAGVTIVDRDWISNSRKAHEAAMFARDAGSFAPFHRAMLDAYFAHGRDIGDINVLLELAGECGLDTVELRAALEDGHYARHVDQDAALAWRIGFTGVPAFILGNRAIIGAQPYQVFEEVMALLGREKRSAVAPPDGSVE